MDMNYIEQLIQLAKTHGLEELKVQYDKYQSVALRFPTISPISQAPVAPMSAPFPSSEPDVSLPAHAVQQDQDTASREGQHCVRTPLIGTVYLAPSPDDPAFVTLGQKVNPGDTLCLIEAMKTFNRIEADQAGVITQCLVEDAQAVEYDQGLFIIEQQP